MNSNSFLAYAAASLSAALALAGVLRKGRSLASWCFGLGMLILALESVLSGIGLKQTNPERLVHWQTMTLLAKSFVPGVWLCFSLTYSRGNYREFIARSWPLLAAAFFLPVALGIGFRSELIHLAPSPATDHGWYLSLSGTGKVLNAILLIATVLILMNLERTFRAAVGTMQWRIKFLVLGLGVVFGARIYTGSQALLFSGNNLAVTGIETGALLIGAILMTIAYLRTGFSEIDVYPSRAVLHTSVTVLLVGGYLFVVGVLAKIVAHQGKSGSFQLQALLVLLAIAFLAVLLLSDRFRQGVQSFVSRNFKRPQHDFRQVWTRFTHTMSRLLDRPGLCTAAAKLISETFNALSVTIWLFDEHKDRLVLGASTSPSLREAAVSAGVFHLSDIKLAELRQLSHPFDLEKANEDWAEGLKRINTSQFRKGGNRICVPLVAGDRWLGIAVLADRVATLPYTLEELDLLECIGDQLAASLLNLSLTQDIVLGKELEAFQTISAFFVHDLKNAASTLSLMLQNLPVHFDDPAFREDALRGITKTVDRINQLIGGLGVLRAKLELRPVEVDLNLLVDETLADLEAKAGVEWVKKFQPVPGLVADRGHLQSVVTNLLLNACDAVGQGGQITVETSQRGRWAALIVADSGCGMSAAFVRESLFRPFQTTKKQGLGIGMFQSKMIIEAHGGNIQVKSELGTGTTFEVRLPLEQHAE